MQNNIIDKFIDVMPDSQDLAGRPLSIDEKEKRCQQIASFNGKGIAVSSPYNVPANYPDADNQTHEWILAAGKFGLWVQLRKSWADDEGWYGIPKQTSNDRITDTANWIKDYNHKYPTDFLHVKIFTPKPEPQNMGISGVNNKTPFRFPDKAAFNKWLRDIVAASKTAFNSIGITNITVGHFGFDGFVVCGFGNPDWQGKTFLEPATVKALGDLIIVDHYPPDGTTFAQFLNLFKSTWPGVKIGIGEYGTTGSGDKTAKLKEVLDSLVNDPIFGGFFNYWNLDGGPDVSLMANPAVAETLKSYYSGSAPTPTPTPTPVPEPAASNAKWIKDKNSSTVYMALPITHEQAAISLGLNVGRSVPRKTDGSVDWEKFRMDGELTLT